MLRQIDVSVTKNAHNGSYECAAIVDGSRVSKVYYGYTKREAVRRFTCGVNAVEVTARMEYERTHQPKTGAKCGCTKGVERDNCSRCEGTGMVIDFRAIRARTQNNS